jgi:hypothetical protein
MSSVVSKDEIQRLMSTPKKLEIDPLKALESLQKKKIPKGHKNKQKKMKVVNSAGDTMEVIVRQGGPDPLNFAAILLYRPPLGEPLRLRRYNGKHEHTNPLQGEQFFDFHIHMATEEYQNAGRSAEGYARPTSRFSDLDGALRCLLEDCGFEGFERKQQELFEETD